MWDRTGAEIDTIPYGGRIAWVDEQHLLLGGTRIYRCEVCTDFEGLVALARSRITRELTAEESQIYLGETA